MPNAHLADILLVEDDPGDARLTQEALKDNRFTNRLSIVEDGEKALQFLRRQPPYEDAPRPDIILLDLNLPRMDGRELLEIIKNDPDLLSIPVVVLTTSNQEIDIVKAYNLQANCFVTKPLEWQHFVDAVRQIEGFWMGIVSLPEKD